MNVPCYYKEMVALAAQKSGLAQEFISGINSGQKSIARSDAARGAYYKSISGKDWGDPHGYELCIDSSIGEEAAAQLICDYVRHR